MPEPRPRPAPPATPARGRRPARAAGRALAGALVTVVLAAGCAAVPTSGLLQTTNLPSGNGGVQRGSDCCGLIMNPPAPGWGPEQIVLNFILASADFDANHAVAREYLTPAASKAWHPGPGPGVTVIAQPPKPVFTNRPYSARGTAVVGISVQELGQVTASGQYVPAQGGQANLQLEFGLQQIHRVWRITNLPSKGVNQPSNELLLTKDLFQLAYQPRNLYYLAPAGKQQLVPDPVFVPVDTADPANDLVRALLPTARGWLAPGVLSAFPPACPAPAAGRCPARQQDRHRGPEPAQNGSHPGHPEPDVRPAGLDADQHVLRTNPGPGGEAAGQWPGLDAAARYQCGAGPGRLPPADAAATHAQEPVLPHPHGCGPQAHRAGHQQQRSPARRGRHGPDTAGQRRRVPGRALPGRPRRTRPSGPPCTPRTWRRPRSRTPARPPARCTAWFSGVRLTSVSWDRYDNLWVAGSARHRGKVWMLPGSGGPPQRVGLPAPTGPITALRVAPDGVRLAMITKLTSGLEVRLAAIVKTNDQIMLSSAGQIGADLAKPSALSWYDADHLLVVNQRRPARS